MAESFFTYLIHKSSSFLPASLLPILSFRIQLTASNLSSWIPKTFLVNYKAFEVSETWIPHSMYELAPFRHVLVVQSLKMSGLAGAYCSVSVPVCVGGTNVLLEGTAVKMEAKLQLVCHTN